jgi:hypothetical protein
MTADDLLLARLDTLASKEVYAASARRKGAYSQDMSAAIALSLSEALHQKGMAGARPNPDAPSGFGAERRMAGGIGAKKVDVTWATEEAGLLLSISVKTINWADAKTGNFQKNLTNRRGDMLFESVTLHRRFPYAVLLGLLFLDAGAADDATDRRRSTFENAHHRFRLFSGRSDPAGRDEQYERLYVCLVDAQPGGSSVACYPAGDPETTVSLERALTEAVQLVAERNPDFYEEVDGLLVTS